MGLEELKRGIRRVFRQSSENSPPFVCLFWNRKRICPSGSTPKGGPTEITTTTQATLPRTFVMHPASGPYPPLSSCPVHITYRVSGLFLPCFPVLHIYSNPTERNPSTHTKPHIQTVLIHYFNKTSPAGSLLAVKLHSENGVIFKGKYEILISLIHQWQDNHRKTMRNQ